MDNRFVDVDGDVEVKMVVSLTLMESLLAIWFRNAIIAGLFARIA